MDVRTNEGLLGFSVDYMAVNRISMGLRRCIIVLLPALGRGTEEQGTNLFIACPTA